MGTHSDPFLPRAVKAESEKQADRVSKQYCKFLPITIRNVATTALIDSGNLWRNAISEDFFRFLGLTKKDLRPIDQERVGTAKKSATLEVLGETRQYIRLFLGKLPVAFRFKPVVIKGLSMPINIGGPFLKKHNIDQLHSKNALRVQEHLVPLLSSHHFSPIPPEVIQSPVYLTETVTLPPGTISHVKGEIQAIKEGQMPCQGGLVSARGSALDEKELLGWIAALVQPDAQGIIPVGLMNLTEESLILERGTKYGNCPHLS